MKPLVLSFAIIFSFFAGIIPFFLPKTTLAQTEDELKEILDVGEDRGCGFIGNKDYLSAFLPGQGCVVLKNGTRWEYPAGQYVQCGNNSNTKTCCVSSTNNAVMNCVDFTKELASLNLQQTFLTESVFNLCQQAGTKQQDCIACVGYDAIPKIWTAVGCIDSSQDGIVKGLVNVALGVAGGIVLFKILGAALKLSMSKGEKKEIEEAREDVTSAIMGVVFILLSMTILEFIGINLLKIPGF